MITAETCEDYYKQLHNLMPDVHPADLIVQVLHDFLRERGMGKKEGSTALERMVGFIEDRLTKPFKIPESNQLPYASFDKEGYPTDDFLEQIENFNPTQIENGLALLFDVVIGAWNHGEPYARKEGDKIHLSTGGWSGNESIIGALKANFLVWSMAYFSHQTGGHYVFRLKK